MTSTGKPPLVVHVIHRLAMGGLENGLINLINQMPPDRFRHAIMCMDGFTAFRNRIARNDVEIFALHCQPGRDPATYWRVWKILREIRPAIVHSRNLAGLDALVPAMLAGVPCRIHGEHGWHDDDTDGSSRKYRLVRRLHRPFVSRYVALSGDLKRYLIDRVGVEPGRIWQIHNGVDTDRFQPPAERTNPPDIPFSQDGRDTVRIGWVGRFEGVKDPMNLASAFVRMLNDSRVLRGRARLIMIGDGPERESVMERLATAGVEACCWLPGARDDIPEILQSLDVFVLPSKGEGISNTILEAMASGLPVIATRVGGNEELVIDGRTGVLVEPERPLELASAITEHVLKSDMRRQRGVLGCKRAREFFSLRAMTDRYLELYSDAIDSATGANSSTQSKA